MISRNQMVYERIRNGVTTARAIAAELGSTMDQVSGSLNRLRKIGAIRKTSCKARVWAWELTAAPEPNWKAPPKAPRKCKAAGVPTGRLSFEKPLLAELWR